VAPQPQAASAVAALPDFAQLVERNGPAVVNIRVEQNVKTSAEMPDFGITPDHPMYEFFRRFQVPHPETPMPSRGMGSGFIVSPDGLILTNAHVVANASEVTVKLSDRREFKARVIGTDRQTDVAALKIDATNLPAVTLGSAQNVRVGEWVVAIGSPFGLGYTVTTGVVSAKGRGGMGVNAVEDYLQTDASINPGNSGGPLVNSAGEVVGINTAIADPGEAQNVGFAMSIDSVKQIIEDLRAGKEVKTAFLGVVTQEVTPALAQEENLSTDSGALVRRINSGTAADDAGIKTGDVITAVNDTPVGSPDELAAAVRKSKPGDRVTVHIERDGDQQTVEVTLGTRPDSD
jgi:serine protease Do